MKTRKPPRAAFAERCGMEDPKTDYFTDVARALKKFLMDRDNDYREYSERVKKRHGTSKANNLHRGSEFTAEEF